MRGNHGAGLATSRAWGPIPANAGEPSILTANRGYCGAYPRECGGTRPAGRLVPLPWGLSPRMRGNPNGVALIPSDTGPIPANAGEPSMYNATKNSFRAYPRECGGTFNLFFACFSDTGLSPRMRGNLNRSPLEHLPQGPIPANAGEPSSRENLG